MKSSRTASNCSIASLTVLVAACGGGGSSVTDPAAIAAEAAAATARSNEYCVAIQPFYWEIGGVEGAKASGSVGPGAPTATTQMAIASASKWIYAAYVAERRGAAGMSASDDVPFLNFTSGYSKFPVPTCPGSGGTINDCLEGARGEQDAMEAAGRLFHYDSGHMEKHASNIGLGEKTGSTLGAEVRLVLGPNFNVAYTDVQVAGGAALDAENYARFLRRMLIGSPAPLLIASILGTNSVCTLPGTCATAVYSPTSFNWQYSLGHWVENDVASIQTENTAFSSAGALGFYPWVNTDRTLYGIVARQAQGGGQQGFASAQCGRLIRLAFARRNPQ